MAWTYFQVMDTEEVKFISHNVKERRKPAVSIFSGKRRHSGAKTFMDIR
jgi:hypothetical protein